MFHIKLAWIWLKENWKIPFLVVWSIIIWALSRKNAEAALDVLAAKKESYDRQIISLKENHNKELTKRDLLIKQYHKTIKDLEEKYAQKNAILTKKNKEKVKQVVEEMEGDPDAVQKKIEELFNFSDLG
jgi:seryl-tRNA synthetase